MQNWYRLLDQVEVKLNLLHPSRLNPIMPAYSKLKCEYYFSPTPMSPLGKRTLAHNKPHNRGTWDPHIHKGWYVSPMMLH